MDDGRAPWRPWQEDPPLTATLTGSQVLITGGAGFIGAELTRQACLAGASVTVVDNLVTGSQDNLRSLLSDRCRFVQADIRDVAQLEPLVRSSQIIYHLAGVGPRAAMTELHQVNVAGTLGLLDLARGSQVERFVHVSTAQVYGNAVQLPIDETHPTIPLTVHAASKLAGEAYARAYHRMHGLPVVVLRPFNTYGPLSHLDSESGEVIPRFLLRCLAQEPMIIFGDGTQTRDFTYVSDMAAWILVAGTRAGTVGETFNLGQGVEVMIGDLARIVARVTNRSHAVICHEASRPGEVRRLCADTGFARSVLGYSPQVSLVEGLGKVRDHYLDTGESGGSMIGKATA